MFGEFLIQIAGDTLEDSGNQRFTVGLIFFFLVTQSIKGNITLADIVPGYKTDHSMWLHLLLIKLIVTLNSEGTRLLETKHVFSNWNSWLKLSTRRMTLLIRSLLWDMIKLKVWEKSLKYAAFKKKYKKQREKEIEQKMSRLEKKNRQ